MTAFLREISKPILFLLLSISNITFVFSQVSEGGIPPSFKSDRLKSTLEEVFVRPPDLRQLQAEDRVNDSLGRPYRIAAMLPVDLCINDAGKWDTLSTGEIIWRLKITSPGAIGLQLLYDKFRLPKGSKLFLYSNDKKFLIGAFNENNNHPSGLFATEIIPDETLILEYVKGTSTEDPLLCISTIGYVYRGLQSLSPGLKNLKEQSESCEVNVRCSPEGDNYADISRAVAKVIMGGYVCSGTMLNNTAQDFRNFFATAFHCIEGQELLAPQYIFYFNYEKTGCANISQSANYRTTTGADIRAAIPLQKGSDGVILELFGTIPSTYNIYWAGWDINETLMAGGASIHHPAGDYKKISTIRSLWTTETWYGIDTTIGATAAHWGIVFAPTKNGYGVTEPGSSGCGLFGPDELFRGQLSGGSSSCTDQTGDNLYGKISYSWNKFSSTPNLQFKSWLDPGNTGITRLKGIDRNTQTGIFWSSSPPVIDIDSTIRFRDESSPNPTSWNWTFNGGTPASSNSPNPVVKYTAPGLYNVSLTITNQNGTFTKTRTDYVYVRPKSAWIVQNSGFSSPARGINGFSIVDSLMVWAWAFDGLDPNNQILEYTYTTNGGKNWQPKTVNLPGVDGYGMSNLYAISKDTAYAAIFGPNGGGKIIRTRNAGTSWEVQSSASYNAPDGFPNLVYFFNKREGVSIGDPNGGFFEIYTTTNAGDTWNRVASPNVPSNLSGETGTTNMYDAKGDTIWFGTSKGRVYRSINRGNNWTVAGTGLSGTTDVRFRSATVGFALQSTDNGNPFAVRKTTDGGHTWQAHAVHPNFRQGDLTYVPGTKASWVSVSGVRSSSGSSYSVNDADTFNVIDNYTQYTAVKFYNPFIGWAGGYNTDAFYGGIYKWNRLGDILLSGSGTPTGPGEKQFVMMPNPVHSTLTIRSLRPFTEDIKISVVNIQGMMLVSYTYRYNQGIFQKDIPVSRYAAGVYIIIVQTGSLVETYRVVKE